MAHHITHYLEDLKKKLLARGEKPDIEITSLPSLNKKIWGIKKGKFYVVGARPGNGKSAFVLQLAVDIAQQGHKVLFLSLEMDILSIIERVFSHHTKIDNMDLLTGKMPLYVNRYDEFSKSMDNTELVIADSIGKSWEEIDNHIESLSVKPDVIIIDHIHEIRETTESRKNVNEYIRHFKEMIIRYNFAGILCAQLNRTASSEESKRPRIHQLKESGKLEESPDVIILLHYPSRQAITQDENKFDIYVDKNRDGRIGHIRLHFQPETYCFTDYEEEETKEEVKWGD